MSSVNALSEPTIPQLPNEVIIDILSALSSYHQGTLASCCAVSRAWNGLATPELYRWSRPVEFVDRDRTQEGIEVISNAPFLRLGIHHLSEIRHLAIGYHPNSYCLDHHDHRMRLPNLKSVQLELGERHQHIQPLHNSDIPYSGTSPSECPLLKGLHPQTVVNRNVSLRMINLNIPSIPTSLWEQVETLVFISSSFEKNQGNGWEPFLPNLPKLERIFWLFDPLAPGESKERKRRNDWNELNLYIISELLSMCESSNVSFCIVNAGSTIMKDPCWRYLSVVKAQKEAEEIIVRKLSDKLRAESSSIDEFDVKDHFNDITFATLEEFIEDEEWYEWMDSEELSRWKKVMSRLPR
ncbi:uncharacterized protein IL334_001718 [Kwoniella shivajii]|uniref:F-box domain-containing protein n=1 Tax=Kwoniella shivajii TaxID=564305 RepID=A0ABZ1CTX2_9TREE|nr:hypothetical protein IL334_001718 [Kwoniella shivajii]